MPVAWVSLAALSIALWVWYALRRPMACSRSVWLCIMGLTGVGLASALIILLNPIWLKPLPPPAGKPLLTILVDESNSMSIKDGSDQASRWELATTAVSEVVDRLESTFDIRVQTFAEEVRPSSLQQLREQVPAGKSTNLAAPIQEALVSDRPQGQALLLLSDGVHNAPGVQDRIYDAANMALSWDAPIYTATFGTKTEVSDVEVRVPRSQELVFVGQSVPLTIELHQHGSVGDRVEVTLESAGEQLATQEVRIAPQTTTPISFLITPPETGLFQYQVKAQVLPGEAAAENNSASFQVRVVDEPVRALVLEGKPYWDNKFLLRMLTNDPSLEVDCLVRVTSDRYLWRRLQLTGTESTQTEEGSPTEPGEGQSPADESTPFRFERRESVEITTDANAVLQDAEQLREYQILLLGREAEAYLSEAAISNIRSWLSEEGGSLICYRGSPVAEPDQQLSRLLPVRWGSGGNPRQNESRFRIQVTERGDDLSWLRLGGGEALAKLPSLATAQTAEFIKPLAVVLGRGEQGQTTAPVLTYQPYGTGKVVVIEGAGMWRWAFLPPDYRDHEPVYGTLWQSLLRWVLSSGGLMPGEEIALQMDRVSFTEGETVTAVVLRRNESDNKAIPHVELRDDQGDLLESSQPIPVGSEPGVYQVFLGQRPVGHYELRFSGEADEMSGTRSVEFDVRPDLREQLEVAARSDVMSRIAELSGGAAFDMGQLSELAETFESHLRQSRPVQYQRATAWDRWWVLTAILLLWSVSWSLRRSSGLI